jgi:hypothetical protein
VGNSLEISFSYLLTKVMAKSKPVTCKFNITGARLYIY